MKTKHQITYTEILEMRTEVACIQTALQNFIAKWDQRFPRKSRVTCPMYAAACDIGQMQADIANMRMQFPCAPHLEAWRKGPGETRPDRVAKANPSMPVKALAPHLPVKAPPKP